MSDCRAYRCHPGTDATRFGLLCEKCWQKLSDDGQAKIAEMAMGLDEELNAQQAKSPYDVLGARVMVMSVAPLWQRDK